MFLWKVFLALFIMCAIAGLILFFKKTQPDTDDDIFTKLKNFYVSLPDTIKRMLLLSVGVFILVFALVMVVTMNVMTARDIQKSAWVDLGNNFSGRICDITWDVFRGLNSFDICVADTGKKPRKELDSDISRRIINDGVILVWKDAFSEQHSDRVSTSGHIYRSTKPPLRVVISMTPHIGEDNYPPNNKFRVVVRTLGDIDFRYGVGFLGLSSRVFEASIIGLFFSILYLVVGVTVVNKPEMKMYLHQRGEFMLPDRWDEDLIRNELMKLQTKPTMLGHAYNEIRERFLVGQSDKTVKKRAAFLRSLEEMLKAGHGVNAVLGDLKVQELEADIRTRKLELEQDELEHRQTKEADIRDLESDLKTAKLKRKISEEESKKKEVERDKTPPQPKVEKTLEQKYLETEDQLRRTELEYGGADSKMLAGREYEDLTSLERVKYDRMCTDYEAKIHDLREKIDKLRARL